MLKLITKKTKGFDSYYKTSDDIYLFYLSKYSEVDKELSYFLTA